MSGRFPWLIAVWTLAIATLALPAAPAHADGKFFPLIAEPTAPTIPAQRAIIGWDPPYQTLAIDTAFVGNGDQFAWLVPLPSEPEITPATRGMFDSVAALTAPRITRASRALPGQTLAVLFIIMAICGLAVRSRARDVVRDVIVVVLVCLLLAVVLFPAIGKSKRSESVPSPAVDVLNRSSAGVYDTVTLSAEHADDLIVWLNDEGFSAPEGVRSVVQDYLDRGWVFAAAKVRSDTPAGEHQPHPLSFRFQADSPVYPMALTGVENTDIYLDLFVFANGSASTDLLDQKCSLTAAHGFDQPADRELAGARDDSDRVRIVHEGLAAIAGGLPNLTRLSGTLAPQAQRADITIEMKPFRRSDPLYALPGQGFERGVSVALWAGAVLLPAVLLVRMLGGIDRKGAWRWSIWVLPVALLAGVAGAFTVRVYEGPTRSGSPSNLLRHGLEAMAVMTLVEAEHAGVHDAVGLRAIAEQQHKATDLDGQIPPFDQGDGPLSTRLVHEPGVGWWFIWRDLAGGAHRVGPHPSEESAPDASGPVSDPG